jgi:hypothetical protein
MSGLEGAAPRLVQVGAVAAGAGGAAWLVKAGAILLTGVQPPLLFEVAPVLFAVGVLGLRALVGRTSVPARLGGWIALVAAALAVVDLGAGPAEGFSPWTLAAVVAILAALVLLGVPTVRRRVLPGRTAWLPLLLGLGTFPLLAVGGALETFDERFLEVPLAVLALGWLWLAVSLWGAVRAGDASKAG